MNCNLFHQYLRWILVLNPDGLKKSVWQNGLQNSCIWVVWLKARMEKYSQTIKRSHFADRNIRSPDAGFDGCHACRKSFLFDPQRRREQAVLVDVVDRCGSWVRTGQRNRPRWPRTHQVKFSNAPGSHSQLGNPWYFFIFKSRLLFCTYISLSVDPVLFQGKVF